MPSQTKHSQNTRGVDRSLSFATPQVERKLVAILSADVKGYSRLMGNDEAGTVRTLTAYREVVAALIQQCRGRMVDVVGDNLMAEFSSAVDAMLSAIEIQKTLKVHNAQLPEQRRMELRIGVNVGDVLVEGDQIFGDGVNIAARMETLADAGGICISGAVYEQVHNKLILQYVDLGEQSVKNIIRPVRVYRVLLEPDTPAQAANRALLPSLVFPPFSLDVPNACLWHGKKRIPLSPKDFAVLHCLARRAGQLVTHEELLKVVWPDAVVSQGVLKVCMRRIRQALGDSPTKPRFIETQHRAGYRFIAPISPGTEAADGPQLGNPKWESESVLHLQPPTPHLVGREREVERLHEWFNKALGGERQIVFVTGEPGIGKTTAVQAFLHEVAAVGGIGITWGRCIEHYGSGEAYLPVLDALRQLCDGPRSHTLVAWIKRHAPTWLVQMPTLLSEVELGDLHPRVLGATRERMLREMLEALEVLTAKQPLLLVLEDLHWCDDSTLTLLSALAQRHEPAQLIVIGTYRSAELRDPLRAIIQELRGHSRCQELTLSPLSTTAVERYVERRFPSSVFSPQLTKLLSEMTGGNPLFLVTLVDDLLAREVFKKTEGGWILSQGLESVASEVPENVRLFIGRQINRLDIRERQMLEAASVAGREFSTAIVAAVTEIDVTTVEKFCDALAQRQHFLRPAGTSEWPDGTLSSRYCFRHALYQYLWNEQVTISQRQRLHSRIGERLETAYGERAGDIAGELAVHFEEGRKFHQALRYRQQAAVNALRRSAYQEAIGHLQQGLAHIETLPEASDQITQELTLQTILGPALMATRGWSDPTTGAAYNRARDLCRQLGENPQLFSSLFGLWAFHTTRAEHNTAHDFGMQLLQLARGMQDQSLVIEASWAAGCSSFYLGNFTAAREHLEQGVTRYDFQQHRNLAAVYGQDPAVSCLCYLALTLWKLGYPDQALRRSHEALSLARTLSYPFTVDWALMNSCLFQLLRRSWSTVIELAKEGLIVSQEQGFSLSFIAFSVSQHLALAMQEHRKEDIGRNIQDCLSSYTTLGDLNLPWNRTLIAENYGRIASLAEGLTALAEGFTVMERTEERHHEAEMWRVKGELLRQKSHDGKRRGIRGPHTKKANTQSPESEVEFCFLKAVDVARSQNAKGLELRAALSLGRFWQSQGKTTQSRQLLTTIYSQFSEGFDTEDLIEARATLEQLQPE